MNRNIILMLIVVLCAFFGCSNSNNTTKPNEWMNDGTAVGNHTIASSGIFMLDQSQGIKVLPDRDAAFHYNVAGFLQSACPGGCIDIQILSIIDEVWTIEITIENPISIQVYDVRVIYYNTAGKNSSEC